MRWADLDQLGHVNNVVYADYLQEARIDLLRTVLPGWRDDLALGVEAALVVRHEITYRAPLEFDGGPVCVEVWVSEVRAATFSLTYEIFHDAQAGGQAGRQAGGEPTGERRVYARAHSVLAPYVFAEARPRRILPEETIALEAYLEPSEPRTPSPVPALDPDGAHRWPFRVRFSDVDLFRHVNNVKYVEFFQEARISMMGGIRRAAEQEAPMVVAQTDIDYLAPVLLRTEPYAVRSRPVRLGGRSLTIDSELVDPLATGDPGSGAAERVLARARVVLVFWDPATGRSAEPPAALRDAFAALLPATG